MFYVLYAIQVCFCTYLSSKMTIIQKKYVVYKFFNFLFACII